MRSVRRVSPFCHIDVSGGGMVRPLLFSSADAKRILRARLLGDWVIVTGDPDVATRLEYEVYKPGTPANNDFEILVAITKDHKVLPIVHARKTPALRKLLALPDQEWSELFEMRLV